ncbi:MFS transporter [Amycolatopsis sp. NPDC059021]|uniref:MFS transporter n=1 Tax=Amycolatopsis sp. NPDC059021 TaxID=3346704 RepID=UPI00366AF24C
MDTVSEKPRTSTIHLARRVLASRPFRRLWLVTGLCSSADWLTVMTLAALAGKLAPNAIGMNFAFSGVLFANILPGLVFAPIGGLLADRFNRRVVMVIADVLRFGLLLSIVFVDEYWWVFAGTFLVQVAAIMWIPCKDAALPNLLRGPEQVESATQLGLVMTYGVSVAIGGGLFTFVTGIPAVFHVPQDMLGLRGFLKLCVVIAALLYLASAVSIATRLPELSQRVARVRPGGPEGPGFREMLRDGARYIRGNRVVRGLLIGMMGAFAAGGAVVGAAQPYALSLLGGQAAFGLLLLAIFVGLVAGLLGAPKLARRVPHARLFGLAIVLAGIGLIPVALSPHLTVAMIAVTLVGACAGTAFLTGITIIGSKVEDAMRGRINAIYQSMLKVVVGCTVAVTPILITVIGKQRFSLWGHPLVVDATRPVILGAGVVCAVIGVVAYRQMDAKSKSPGIADLVRVMRRRPAHTRGFLLVLEGETDGTRAGRLVERLGVEFGDSLCAVDPTMDLARQHDVVSLVDLTGTRARALVAAAVHADSVERVTSALESGRIVVTRRFAELVPLASAAEDADDLRELASWAADPAPDLVVLFDSASSGASSPSSDQHWQVGQMIAEIATYRADRHLVVDPEESPDDVADRVTSIVRAALARSA